MARIVLVIAEAKYWGDLKTGLAQVGVGFLGFDKKKPSKSEIERLVAKADFIVMRNVNVAHHSVSFAKEAAKVMNKPFWISHNFGLGTILSKLSETFPAEDFSLAKASKKKVPSENKKKNQNKAQTPLTKQSNTSARSSKPISKKPKSAGSESMKNALKGLKIEEEIDFEKLFGK